MRPLASASLSLVLLAAACPSDDTAASGSGSSSTTSDGGVTSLLGTEGDASASGPIVTSSSGGLATSDATTGEPPPVTGDSTVGDELTTSSTSGSGSGSGSDSGSGSTTGGAADVCMGPAPNAVCMNPSPYTGVGTCDPYAQDCPVGEKCMPWSNDGGGAWNATTCSPIDPMPDQLGDPCMVVGSGVSGIDSCDIGLMCWNVDPMTNLGTCIELCACGPLEPTCPSGGATCGIFNDGTLPICLQTCDPLGNDCAANEVCVAAPGMAGDLPDDWFFCAPDASGGMAAVGDPCEFVNVCGPGVYCTPAAYVPGCLGGTGCCTEYCDEDNGAGDCSTPGHDCVSVYPAGMALEACLEDTGVCGVAP